MTFQAPLRDIRFTLDHIVGLSDLNPPFGDLSDDLVGAILGEAGRLGNEVLAPLNQVGDRQPCRLEGTVVKTTPGFKEAWRQFVDGGWGAIPFSPSYGGQGLPRTLGLAVEEIWHGANMSLGLCPLLTSGAIELLSEHGTPEQKSTYLPKLISGEWTGTMNLTEPQAGSDVGAVRAKAERQDDGTYKVKGAKIFITFGEHDMADNIIHLVLARLPDSPPGTRGISLFIVPKFLVNPDGSLGARNDVSCTSIEEKLGIHASPTCTMTFGDQGGAIGFLVGAENAGMKAMFTMMNNARLSVGLESVGVAEAATQKAILFASERLQGKPFGLQHSLREMIPIVSHPDVRRMLYTMKSLTEAMRAICYATGRAIDDAKSAAGDVAKQKARARENILTPIAKGWCTDRGVEIASIGIQVHGGMGFVEETGAAQFFRDARILPIYEGTNGIQAIDLVTRKLGLDGGAAFDDLCAEIREEAVALKQTGDTELIAIAARLEEGERMLAENGRWLRTRLAEAPADALAGASAFLEMAGFVVGGYFLGKGARAAWQMKSAEPENRFASGKIATAKFFAEVLMSRTSGLGAAVRCGSELLNETAIEELFL